METSFRALVGGAYAHVPSAAYNVPSESTFAALVGSNVDFKLSRRVALRFSPGVYVTRYGADQTQKNFRFSVGPCSSLEVRVRASAAGQHSVGRGSSATQIGPRPVLF